MREDTKVPRGCAQPNLVRSLAKDTLSDLASWCLAERDSESHNRVPKTRASLANCSRNSSSSKKEINHRGRRAVARNAEANHRGGAEYGE